jgi:hypothetical protein
MGVVNTSEACEVLGIKITSWRIPIWCGVRGKLANKNFKDSNLLSRMVNEGLTGSTCSLSDLLLSTTGSLTIVVFVIGYSKSLNR